MLTEWDADDRLGWIAAVGPDHGDALGSRDNLRPTTQAETRRGRKSLLLPAAAKLASPIRNKSDEASKVAKYKTGMNPKTSRPACRGAALCKNDHGDPNHEAMN